MFCTWPENLKAFEMNVPSRLFLLVEWYLQTYCNTTINITFVVL